MQIKFKIALRVSECVGDLRIVWKYKNYDEPNRHVVALMAVRSHQCDYKIIFIIGIHNIKKIHRHDATNEPGHLCVTASGFFGETTKIALEWINIILSNSCFFSFYSYFYVERVASDTFLPLSILLFRVYIPGIRWRHLISLWTINCDYYRWWWHSEPAQSVKHVGGWT